MVGALIVFLVVLAILAIFIGKNVHNTCSIWLFHQFNDISSVSVILFAFAVGILFSMFCFFISFLIRKDRKNLAGKKIEKAPVKSESKSEIKDENIKQKKAFGFGKKMKVKNIKTESDVAEKSADNELQKSDDNSIENK